MTPYASTAVAFASALVDADFDRAHSLLTPGLRADLTPADLRDRLHQMFSGYADGAPVRFHFDEEFCLEEWPDKQTGDVGWAYVSVEGEDFVEAVSVVVASVDGALLIRNIEWGRP